jgi:hypothetical protein
VVQQFIGHFSGKRPLVDNFLPTIQAPIGVTLVPLSDP